jgi:predicted transcriptional regulator
MPDDVKAAYLPLVTEVVAAHLSNNSVPSLEVAPLIRSVYQTLAELSVNGTPAPSRLLKKSLV